MSKQKPWSYKEGQYGCMVRVYERRGRPNLYMKFWSVPDSQMIQMCLGHADRELARQQCRQISDDLRHGRPVQKAESACAPAAALPAVPVPSSETVTRSSQVTTFRMLFQLYLNGKYPERTSKAYTEALRRCKIWLAFLRTTDVDGGRVVSADQLGENHLSNFIQRRRTAGGICVPGVRLGTTRRTPRDGEEPGAIRHIGERSIEADLGFLKQVLRWGHRSKRNGAPLVAEEPRMFPPMPRELEKHRPVMGHREYRVLRRIADAIDRQALFGCFIRLQDDLGWRVSALCALSAFDVDLRPTLGAPYGRVRKNPRNDKRKRDQFIPLSRHARATFVRLLERRALAPGDRELLFPAPRRKEEPWSRFHVRALQKRALLRAGLPLDGLVGAHAFRRKWATERKGYPIVDVMHAGGWTDHRTLEQCYFRSDPATVLDVVTRPTRRYERGTALR